MTNYLAAKQWPKYHLEQSPCKYSIDFEHVRNRKKQGILQRQSMQMSENDGFSIAIR
jgi:hypothetical protein